MHKLSESYIFLIVSILVVNTLTSISEKLEAEESEIEFPMTISFMLSARDLPLGLDFFNSPPDAYVIFYKNGNGNETWKEIAKTKIVIDSQNPNWREILVDNSVKLNQGQKWRFEVFDYDLIGDDEYIGHVTVGVDDFVNYNTSYLARNITQSNTSYLILYKQ